MATISIKKSIIPHLEIGYQFDYMFVRGKVNVNNTDTKVFTQAYVHSYLLQFNLRRTDEFRPPVNYFLHYKIGGISLKNDPLDKLPESNISNTSAPKENFINNVAVLTGIGVGINYQLNNNFSFISSFDLNRSADAVEDIYEFYKLFYHASHTVNNYISLSFGISYWFNFYRSQGAKYYKPRTETERQLIQSKIVRKKGRYSTANRSVWYNYRSGI
jgi:hypothetical protein